jgi:hypothetical protein
VCLSPPGSFYPCSGVKAINPYEPEPVKVFSDFFYVRLTIVPPNSVRSSVIHQEEENVKVILSERAIKDVAVCYDSNYHCRTKIPIPHLPHEELLKVPKHF